MRILGFLLLLAGLGPGLRSQEAFLAKPYLQVGAAPKADRLELLWLARDVDHAWTVTLKTLGESAWKSASAATCRTVTLAGLPPHRIYAAKLQGLKAGAAFQYRVSMDGRTVFEAKGRGPKNATQPQHILLFGDGATGSPHQKAIAARMAQQDPDAVFILGDIVYSRGRASEYLDRFFPIYNADEHGPGQGGPLMRSVPFIPVLGNHDVMPLNARGDRPSDGLAYYLYWSLPLNGPLLKAGGPNTPIIQPLYWSEFLKGTGPRFPGMGNYSFTLGNAHWTVLDSNPYVDWLDPALKAWLEADLREASKATWRFVLFHHPGFNGSVAHAEDQWMRLLSPVFEKHGVQLVFSGHVHAYQRSRPLTFKPEAATDATAARKGLADVNGAFAIDRAFDGHRATKARGIIYVISGAGGAELYNTKQDHKPESWQAFTQTMVSDRYSFTVLDLKGGRAELRQLAEDGTEIDHFVLTR